MKLDPASSRRMIDRAHRCSDLIEEIEPLVWDYDARKKHSRNHIRDFLQHEDWWEEMPAEWEGVAVSMISCGAVLTSLSLTAAFIRSVGDSLSADAQQLCRLWRTEPWFYTFYTVAGDHSDSLLSVRPIGSGETLTLYSPTAAREFHEGRRFYLSLLFFDGECHQTYGPVFSCPSFLERDISFFRSAVIYSENLQRVGYDRANREEDRSSIQLPYPEFIRKHIVPVLGLIPFSHTPAVKMGSEESVYCAGWAEPGEGETGSPMIRSITDVLGRAGYEPEVEEQDMGLHIVLRNDPGGAVPSDVFIYDRQIMVSTLSASAYSRLAETLGGTCSLPSDPQRSCSIPMYAAASKILGPSNRIAYLQPFADDAPAEDPTLADMNRILKRLAQDRNFGRRPSADEIAAELDLPIDDVKEAIRVFDESMTHTASKMPDVDHLGLSPAQMQSLLSGKLPGEPDSLRYRYPSEYGDTDPAILQKSWLYTGVRRLLATISSGNGVRLTAAGYLPIGIVDDFYRSGTIPSIVTPEIAGSKPELEKAIRPKKEMDWTELRLVRALAVHCGFVSMRSGKLLLTPSGESITADPWEMYRILLDNGFESFDWGEYDRIGSVPFIANTRGFMLYASRLMSGPIEKARWVSEQELMDAFFRAFPTLRGEHEDLVSVTVRLRILERIAVGYGFLESRVKDGLSKYDYLSVTEYRTAPLFDTIFEFHHPG